MSFRVIHWKLKVTAILHANVGRAQSSHFRHSIAQGVACIPKTLHWCGSLPTEKELQQMRNDIATQNRKILQNAHLAMIVDSVPITVRG
jgi:hypothetical protein